MATQPTPGRSSPAAEPLFCCVCHWGIHAHEAAFRISELRCSIAPGHRFRLEDHLHFGLQSPELGIDVIHLKLQDGGPVGAAERDPEIARMYSKLQDGYSAPSRPIIQRAIQRDELPKTTDIDVLIAALTGPLFYRRWFSREPLTQSFVKQVIRWVLCMDKRSASTG